MAERRGAAADRLQQKRSRLRRLRLYMTGLLGLMAALFAAASVLKTQYPILAWLQAFAEAGLVGGLADWFAVVALFRHPLGLKIPHTAIVPRNKDRIGRALGEFVEHKFLTPSQIVARLEGVNLALRATRWLARPQSAAIIAREVKGLVPRLVEALDGSDFEGVIGRSLGQTIERLDFGQLGVGLLSGVVRKYWHQTLLDAVLKALGDWLDKNRPALGARLAGGSWYMPKFVDTFVANRVLDAVRELLENVVATPRHELRVEFDTLVRDFIERLKTEPELQDKVEQLKQEMLKLVDIEAVVQYIWREIKERLRAGSEGTPSGIEQQIAAWLVQLAGDTAQDPVRLDWLNQGAIRLVADALKRYGHKISTLIADVVRGWNEHEVARNIELEVGSDLQFIRLNGTLVGGGAGLLLHWGLVLAGLA